MKKPMLAWILEALGFFAWAIVVVNVLTVVVDSANWDRAGGQTILFTAIALALMTGGFIVKKLAQISSQKMP
jgi:hypothetical protein